MALKVAKGEESEADTIRPTKSTHVVAVMNEYRNPLP